MTRPTMDFRLKLEIQRKDTNKGIVIADEYADITKGLDISFEINKSYENKPTASTITVYNLSKETYNDIYLNANAFRLSCARGVDEDFVPFYTGYPIRAKQTAKTTVLTSNQGFMAQDANAGRRGQNDLETTITLMNYGFAKLYTSYQANVSSEVVINDCISALGLDKGNVDTWTDVTLPKGFTIRGDVSKALDELGKQIGFTWNCNDMKFNIYAKGKDDMKRYGIVLTPDNSGTPERQDDKFKYINEVIQKTKDKKGKEKEKKVKVERISQGFKIQTELVPHLVCGSTCYLKDFNMADADGSKYVYKIKHVGSNTGTDAYTEIYFT